MRSVGYALFGLLCGGVAGFWLGLMTGLIYADWAAISCPEGLCATLAATVGAFGAGPGAIAGAVYGLHRAAASEMRTRGAVRRSGLV